MTESNTRVLVAVLVGLLVLFMVAKGQDCTLDRYDLTTVQKQRYWQVEVAGTDCYKYYQGGSCTVYFSVCGDLPDYLCGSKGVAVCQVAVSADRKKQSSFILGTIGTRSFSSLGEVGFREHFSNGSKSNVCNTSIAINIMYTCDVTAIWLGGAISASLHLARFSIDGCQSNLELRYSGACYDPGPPQSCRYTGSYNITTLTSREMWYILVPSPALCYPTTSSITNACIMLLSFCRPLPRGACNNSTFCQATPSISLSVLSFGTYNPEIQLQISNDIEEFTISNTGGSAIGSCTSGLNSSVVFQCDPNARWEELQEGNITHHIRSIEHDAAKCMITIKVGYSGACQSLDTDECEEHSSGCTQICNNTPGSYFCTCLVGYSLSTDNHTCNDINECNTTNGGCAHVCTNSIGSYQCSCRTGYDLNINNHGCDVSLGVIVAGSVVGVVILLVSTVVGIIIAAVTYRHINRKYGRYTRVGVHASEEQMERLLFRGQTSESDQSDDETRSPPPATNDDEEQPSALPHS